MQNPDHSKAEGSEKKESLSEKKTDKTALNLIHDKMVQAAISNPF